MFSNILTIILVLLLYSVSSPRDFALPPGTTLLGIAALFALFGAFTQLRFALLAARHGEQGKNPAVLAAFDRIVSTQSVACILISAIHLFGLNIKGLFVSLPIFAAIPTLGALAFIGIFLLHQCLVWFLAWPVQNLIQGAVLQSRGGFVRSNLMLGMPALVPWALFSGLADVLGLVAWPPLATAFNSVAGQVVYFLIFLAGLSILGPLLVVRFWGCRPLPPSPERSQMEILCKKTGVKYRQILLWPLFSGAMITAGVMGLVSRFRFILVTNGLLSVVTPEELNSVLAHEIGHVKHHHLWLYLGFLVGFSLLGFFVIMATPLLLGAAYLALPNSVSLTGAQFMSFGQDAGTLLFVICAFVYFRFVFGFFMRNFERQADLYALTLTGSPGPLIAVFLKIAFYMGRAVDTPNWHHFSIQQRVDFLRKSYSDPKNIVAHNKKVRKGLVAMGLAMALVAGATYSLGWSSFGDRLHFGLYERVYKAQIERLENPLPAWAALAGFYWERGMTQKALEALENTGGPSLQSAQTNLAIGVLYLESGQEEKAAKAFETALLLDPQSPEAANNLAWVLAVSQNPAIADPARALALAQKAAAKDSSAYILDTLATSYFVNGLFEDAVNAQKKALEKAIRENAPNLDHYKEQLEKFSQALSGLAQP
ncbi:MAG: M48 family metalloprotease [Desulfatibacillaceae bacterium]|nr:M48 family metalloprotease [Desulfatibacillaceae bacterium]